MDKKAPAKRKKTCDFTNISFWVNEIKPKLRAFLSKSLIENATSFNFSDLLLNIVLQITLLADHFEWKAEKFTEISYFFISDEKLNSKYFFIKD